jgi:23S rRNA (uridine2552-2'-O)-methyltransferase
MKQKKKKHKLWEDHYSRQAKKECYPARSVYKIKEIQQKFRLIQKGDRVLDLGCAPGSWSLYAAGLAGESGRVVGIDLKPVTVKVPANVRTYTGDIDAMDATLVESIGRHYAVVLSDMAPATTGNKTVDAARSLNLCESALAIAQNVLKPGGAFVCKIFQGQDFKEFTELIRKSFATCKVFKPQSSRKASKEIFIIGTGFRGQ